MLLFGNYCIINKSIEEYLFIVIFSAISQVLWFPPPIGWSAKQAEWTLSRDEYFVLGLSNLAST
jgi:hypothetical protein